MDLVGVDLMDVEPVGVNLVDGGEVDVSNASGEPAGDPDRPDREALARVAAGDTEAFSELVERHQDRLVRLCRSFLGSPEDACDAAQEVFLKAFRKAGSYRPRGRVYTWLYRIAVNHCLNQLRRRRIVRFLPFLSESEGGDGETDGLALDPADPAPDPGDRLEARRRWQATRRALDALPANQRTVVILSRFEALPQRRIAEVLGITEGAVESRLFRALRRLEAVLEDSRGAARTEEQGSLPIRAQEGAGSGVSRIRRGSR